MFRPFRAVLPVTTKKLVCAKWRHYCSPKQFLFDWRSSKEIPILCKRARVLTKYTDTLPSCKELFRSSVVTSVQTPTVQMHSQSPSLGVGVHAESQGLLGCVNFSNSQQKVRFRCNKNESNHGVAVLTVAPQLGCVMEQNWSHGAAHKSSDEQQLREEIRHGPGKYWMHTWGSPREGETIPVCH